MWRRLFSIFFMLAASSMMAFGIASVDAEAAVSSNYEYEILSDGSVRITDYNGTGSSATIPETIDGRSVSAVASQAFSNSSIRNYYIYPPNVRLEEYSIGTAGTDQYLKGVTIHCNYSSTAEAFLEKVNIKYPHYRGNGIFVYSGASGWVLRSFDSTAYPVVWYDSDDWKFDPLSNNTGPIWLIDNSYDYDDDDDDDDDDEEEADDVVPKLTKVHWRKNEKATFYWKYSEEATGYKLEYSTDPDFAKAKTKSVSRKKKEGTIQGLKVDKTYYIRVRPYVLDDGTKLWSEWSHRIIVTRKR